MDTNIRQGKVHGLIKYESPHIRQVEACADDLNIS